MPNELDEFLDAIRRTGDDDVAEMLALRIGKILTNERLVDATLAVAMVTVALAIGGRRRGGDPGEDAATVLAGIASIATDMARVVMAEAAE